MNYVDAFRALSRHRTDQVVVASAGHSCQAWWAATRDCHGTFYLGASMGMSSLFGAGLALAQPDLRVWVFVGDGAFCMNPGSLMVERQLDLPNLTHILVSNGVYGGTLNAALPNFANNDYAAIARGMGFERVFELDSLEAIEREFPSIANGRASGCTFVVLEVEPFGESEKGLRGPPIEGVELKFLFGRDVERRTGCDVFGYPIQPRN